VSAVTAYVKGKLGQAFVESPEIILHKLWVSNIESICKPKE